MTVNSRSNAHTKTECREKVFTIFLSIIVRQLKKSVSKGSGHLVTSMKHILYLSSKKVSSGRRAPAFVEPNQSNSFCDLVHFTRPPRGSRTPDQCK
jgi:hypothetical protein